MKEEILAVPLDPSLKKRFAKISKENEGRAAGRQAAVLIKDYVKENLETDESK